MRLVIAAAVTATTVGALLIAVPAAADAGTSSTCATQSRYHRIHDGQTVAQVQHEMGSAGAGRPSPGHGPGTRALEKTWKDCSVLGVPVKGALEFGIDFEADAGKRLTVVGKSELPPTKVSDLTSVLTG